MASSQVEIASSSPFGCVLRDHNRHELFGRDSNARATVGFHKNLKGLVRENLQTCTSISTDSASNENSRNHTSNNVDDHRQNLRRTTNTPGNNAGNLDHSSAMSSEQALILDQWAARQARGMVSTIERQNDKAGILISSSKKSSSTRQNSQNSAPQSENSSESKNPGASSLVQIWEARLNRSGPRLNKSHSMNNSRTSSESSQIGNALSCIADESRQSDTGNYTTKEDSLRDSKSAKSAPSSIQVSKTDAGEAEKVRIVDIIRKLTSDGNDHEQQPNSAGDRLSRERRLSAGSDQTEHKVLSQVVSSPKIKIRGRQAYNELLLQMEQERHGELGSLAQRQAVSKFAQRGRIQSLLRLRFLQRGMAFEDQQRPQSSHSTTSSPSNQSQQGSNIMQLRERFSACVEKAATQSCSATPRSAKDIVNNCADTSNSSTQCELIAEAQSCSATPRTTKDMVNNRPDTINGSTKCEVIAECHHQGTSTSPGEQRSKPQVQNSALHRTEVREKAFKETNASSDATGQGTSLKVKNSDSPGSAESTPSFKGTAEVREKIYEEKIYQIEVRGKVYTETSVSSDTTWQCPSLQVQNCNSRETSERTTSLNEWDVNEIEEVDEDELASDQYYEETTYDWFSDIARPRSYWEDLRRAWYEEKLNTSSDNDEIKQLLERRTVSSFLDSDLRDRIDRLMVSRVQIQAISQEDEELEDEDNQERMAQLLSSYFQRQAQPAGIQEDQRREQEGDGGSGGRVGEAEEEEEEAESTTSHQYAEATDFFDPSSPSMHPYPFSSWNYSQVVEVADDSERAPTAALQLPFPSRGSNQDRQCSSSITHSSNEMELIYDLKGHMEQLQREMSELQKSIQTCIEMQVNLQKSLKQEVHPAQGDVKNPVGRIPNKRSCCICYEKQVDSFLYRCGHMCTCLKCARELQQSSGKCPICRASILDVVRAFLDS